MIEICKLAEKKGFKKWFADYSEKYHGLKGWLENDQYLDEVELPDEIMLFLIQTWAREKLGKNIEIISHKYKTKQLNNLPRTFKYKTDKGYSENYNSYREALKAGLKEILDDSNKRS